MISNLGYSLLFLQITLGLVLPLSSKFYFHKINDFQFNKLLRVLTSAMTFTAIASQLTLICGYLISDYSILNVYQNSHHLKPLIYKISGSWGNHEGSMLLLITVLCCYNSAFEFFIKKPIEFKITTISLQAVIILLFTLYTTFASNPFVINQIGMFRLVEGLGLNPVLQDIGLSLHPPMLYTGYLGFSMVFCIMLSCLINNYFQAEAIRILSNWLYFAFSFLTLGIALGAWWAYRELGWGGYWFFDPVENISLMPWLCATALIHSLKFANVNLAMKYWSGFLAILSFILGLFGIFLTRSGLLTSVHSFAVDTNRSYFIILIISLIGGFGLLILGKKTIIDDKKIMLTTQNKTKYWLITINNYFLLGALFVLIIGTLYPIYLRAFFNQSITVGAQYYQIIFSYLLIPFLIFLSFSNYQLKSIRNNRTYQLQIITSLLLSGFFSWYLIKENHSLNYLQIIIVFLSFFAVFSSLFARHNLYTRFAHFGFSLMILGIILSSYFGIVKELNMKISQSISIQDYQINFQQISYLQGKNYLARQGEFSIKKNDQLITNLTPQLRFFPEGQQTTNEASIYHGLQGDLYIVIGNKDDQENYAVRIYFKPFIYLIWLGVLIIFITILLRIYFNNKFFRFNF